MTEAINPGDRVQVMGGQFDGLTGILGIGRPFDSLEGKEYAGRLIVIRGDDGKSYPMPRSCFEELRLINEP